MIIDGKKIANEILGRLKSLPKPTRFLAAVLVGDDASSVSFLKQKEKTAKELGVDFRLYKFQEDISKDDLRKEVGKISAHKTCGGVLVQLPLPNKLDAQYALNAVPCEKDVDVLGERAIGAFYADRNPVLPPAVGTVEMILSTLHFQLSTSRVAVVGRGLLVGKPIAVWLMNKAKELVVFGRNGDLGVLKNADLVITGVGKAGLMKPDMLKPGAGVIDFGYDGGKGDFDPTGFEGGWHTPTPGGTGPILVAKLFENFYALNREKD